jgi:hypothetical protein
MSAIAGENSAATDGFMKDANPHTDSPRNLKRLPKSKTLKRRKEGAAPRIGMVGNDRALERKGCQ